MNLEKIISNSIPIIVFGTISFIILYRDYKQRNYFSYTSNIKKAIEN